MIQLIHLIRMRQLVNAAEIPRFREAQGGKLGVLRGLWLGVGCGRGHCLKEQLRGGLHFKLLELYC